MPKRRKPGLERYTPIELPLFAEAASLIRVRSECNEFRYYRMEIWLDLLGRALLLRQCGRIGTPGSPPPRSPSPSPSPSRPRRRYQCARRPRLPKTPPRLSGRHRMSRRPVRMTAGIPLNLVQKWLGHAQLSTTAIYANAVGVEEKDIAQCMWR
jgi:hypothetical protein